MDVDGGAGLPLGGGGGLEHLALERSERPHAADLADDAGPDVGAPATLGDLTDDFAGQPVHRPLLHLVRDVLVHVVAGALDDGHPRCFRQAAQSLRIGFETEVAEVDDGRAAGFAESDQLGESYGMVVVRLVAVIAGGVAVDLPDVIQGDGDGGRARRLGLGAHLGAGHVPQDMLVHQRGTQIFRLDRAAHGLDPVLALVGHGTSPGDARPLPRSPAGPSRGPTARWQDYPGALSMPSHPSSLSDAPGGHRGCPPDAKCGGRPRDPRGATGGVPDAKCGGRPRIIGAGE